MTAHNFTVGASANAGILAPLDVETIRHRAPSVFADNAAPGTSTRYNFVKTANILDALRDVGFAVVQVRQSQARTDDGVPYVKHAVRLAHKDYLEGRVCVGDVIPQVVLTNSHNRTSAFVLELGFYRLLCSNGLMCCTTDFAGVRVLHSDKRIYDHIIDGTNLIREVTEKTALPMIEKMQGITLTRDLQQEFALAATYLKWDVEKPEHVPNLLMARRTEDQGDSLWHVLNRVQENAVRGGYAGRDRGGRKITVAGIKSVDRDREFNLNLWLTAAEVAQTVQ